MEFYPNSEENVSLRKRYYTLAIADYRMLQEDVKCLIEVSGNVRASTFGELVEMIDDEIRELKAKRKNVRVH